MLTLKEFMELVDFKITEGSDYWPQGDFGGRQLYSLSSWNGDQDGWSFNIGFDPKGDQRVYIVEACDYKNNRAYRLVDSSLLVSKEAWDGVDYVDLEEDNDFIQKALAIKAGENYDTRVSVPLTVPDDVLFKLMKRAHEQDITLNELIEEVLWTAIRDEKSRQRNEEDDHWDDDIEEMASDIQDFKPAAMKAKKKNRKKVKE
jgi:hypothetical protein